LVFLIIGQIRCLGQDKLLPFYYPDGTKYKGTARNIGQINKELEKLGRVYIVTPYTDNGDYLTSVGYILFTDKPLWVLTDSPDKIKDAITRFDLPEFLASWKFEFELENHVKKGVLTDLFILETLGAPTNRTKYFDHNLSVEVWSYESLSLVLTLKRGIVTGYTKRE